MTDNKFPLFKLQQKPILNIVKCLNPLEQFAFTFCSKRTLKLVKLLNLHVTHITLLLYNNLEMRYYPSNGMPMMIKFCGPASLDEVENRNLVRFSDHIEATFTQGEVGEVNQWKKANYGLRDYIDHILSIFKNHFKVLLFILSDHFTTTSIRDTLKGVRITNMDTGLCWNLPREYSKQLMKDLEPTERRLINNFEYREPEDNVLLIGNFDRLTFDCNLTLDQLLITNSKHIEVHGNFSNKSLNRFLKFWIAGGYRRLRWADFSVPEEHTLILAEIMKGIRYIPMPPDEIREFLINEDDPIQYDRVSNGLDIRGKDGIKATVRFRMHGFNKVSVFVWP